MPAISSTHRQSPRSTVHASPAAPAGPGGRAAPGQRRARPARRPGVSLLDQLL